MKNTIKHIFIAAALVLVSNIAIASASTVGSSQSFTSSGSYTVPSDVTQITVEVWGGGGAAGYGAKIGNSNMSGFGGGAGGYSKKVLSVNPGDVLNFNVGYGGSGSQGAAGVSGQGAGGQVSYVTYNGITFGAGGGGGGMSGVTKYACNGDAGHDGGNPGGGYGGNFDTSCQGGSSAWNSAGGQGGFGFGGDVNVEGGNGGPYAMTPGTQDNPYASSGGDAPYGGQGGLRGRCGADGSCPGSDVASYNNHDWAEAGGFPGGGGGGSDVGAGGQGANGEVVITIAGVNAPSGGGNNNPPPNNSGGNNNPPPPTTHYLTVQVTGPGSVTSTPSGIGCPTTSCSEQVTNGSTVTLNEQPVPGFYFTGWGGTCSGTNTTCTLAINNDTTVTATFGALNIPVVTPPVVTPPSGPSSNTLTVQISGSGTVVDTTGAIGCPTNACSASFTDGTTVTLTATPVPGYYFTGWSGPCGSSNPSCSVTIGSTDVTVGASFAPLSVPSNPVFYHTLTVQINGSGTVSGTAAGVSTTINCSSGTCSANFPAGTQVTLNATPASGNVFNGWSGAGCSGTGQCVIVMNTDNTVAANFASGFNGGGTPTPASTLTVTVVGGGVVTSAPGGINCPGTCSATYNNGTTVTLTATPNSGFTFSGWGGACSGTGTCTVTIGSNTTVTATFTAVSSGGGGGPLTLSCIANPGAAYQGSGVAFTANVTGGTAPYTYVWTGDDSLSGSSQTINHTYYSTGGFNAQVVVTSADNQTLTRTCSVSVLAPISGGGGSGPSGGGGGGLNQPDVSIINQTNEPGSLASAGVISLVDVPYTGLTDYPSWVYFLIGLAFLSALSSAGYMIFKKVQTNHAAYESIS